MTVHHRGETPPHGWLHAAAWRLLAAAAAAGLVACSSAATPGPHFSAASSARTTTTSAAASAASPAASHSASQASAVPTGDTASRAAAYAAAIAEVNAYLKLLVKSGPYAAAAAYLTPDELPATSDAASWPPPATADPGFPVLLAGSVRTYIPWAWTSSDQFTLYVEMNMTFRGDPARANYAQGANWSFFTFTRASAAARYRMSRGSSP